MLVSYCSMLAWPDNQAHGGLLLNLTVFSAPKSKAFFLILDLSGLARCGEEVCVTRLICLNVAKST